MSAVVFDVPTNLLRRNPVFPSKAKCNFLPLINFIPQTSLALISLGHSVICVAEARGVGGGGGDLCKHAMEITVAGFCETIYCYGSMFSL